MDSLLLLKRGMKRMDVINQNSIIPKVTMCDSLP